LSKKLSKKKGKNKMQNEQIEPAVPLKNDLLQEIVEQERQAKEFGFYWESVEQLLEQVRSECLEIEEAKLKGDLIHLKEEVGDLMSVAISLCIFLKLDPYNTLKDNIEKFQRRYDKLVSLVQHDGLSNLTNQPLNVLLSYWDKAKKSVSVA
jgi:uncharacterized protein YabN with tetrapyrrole methylase and pyrophosphatase domain